MTIGCLAINYLLTELVSLGLQDSVYLYIQNIEGNGTKHTTEATCADPESFDHSTFDNVLFCIQLMGESKIPLKSGPSSARQRSVIYMAFRWRGNDGQN